MSKVLVDNHDDTIVTTSRPRMSKSSYIPAYEVITEVDEDDQVTNSHVHSDKEQEKEKETEEPVKKPMSSSSPFMTFFDTPKKEEPVSIEADPDSCRMLMNPMVTVSKPKGRADMESESPVEQAKSKSTRELTDFFSRKEQMDTMTDLVTQEDRPRHRPEREDNDFTSFLNELPTKEPPSLVSPNEKLSPESRRQLKAELFLEYQSRNPDYKYCPIVLSLEESSLEEIHTAVEFVRRKKTHENTKSNLKSIMVMGAQGAVTVVNSQNLLGCDMSDWCNDFAYELNAKGKYDDLLDELIRQYRNKLEMPIELKLVLAIGGSFVSGVMAKRQIMKLEAKVSDELAQKRAVHDAERERLAEREQNIARQAQHAQDTLAQQMRAYQESQMKQNQQVQQQVQQVYQQEPAQLVIDGPARSASELRELFKSQIMDDDEESVVSQNEMMIMPQDVIEAIEAEEEKAPVATPSKAPNKRRAPAKKAKSKNEEEDETLLLVM